ncbi:MAG: putative sulfate/molybdate transporter [Methanospirillum sp.]|nr:putative sulfate/molybdate transporter [Methanospirillum sp.]
MHNNHLSGILSEVAGSAGNFGTVLPLLFAVSVSSGMDFSLMLIWAAIWYIISGLYYRIPVSVEPFKAVGAIAIADHLSPDLIAASGILIGIICFIIGAGRCMNRLQKLIPEPVIRGVQLGLALILIKSAIAGFIIPDLAFAGMAGGCILVFYLFRSRFRIPDLSALCIITAGFLFAFIIAGFPSAGVLPLPHLTIPSGSAFLTALVLLVPPQLPLTLTNAILATSLLISDLFNRNEDPDRLSRTVGLMSASSSLFGGFPMCHGAGGLAAHYRFGARGGLSMVIGGCLLLFIAGVCTTPDIMKNLPEGMFGVLLLVVAIELASHGIKTKNRFVTAVIALLAIPAGLAVAFGAGLITAWILMYRKDPS